MSNNAPSVRDMIRENEVTMMRSYLEVDVAEWFSENEIPFGYEAFVIPSVVGPSKDRWDDTVDAIQSVGRGDRDSVTLPDGSEMDAFDILSLWNDIYQKHRLAGQQIVIDPKPALSRFSKKLMMPDFAIYLDHDGNMAGDDFDWGSYDYIIEVSGLYGVGLPGEAEDDEWWTWYRVSAVAFKEFMYRMLGLWDDILWVIPDGGGGDADGPGVPKKLRNDEHYIIMSTTQQGLSLNELSRKMGISTEPTDAGLSPAITPTKYDRATTSSATYDRGQLTPIEYTYDGIDTTNIDENANAVMLDEGFVMFHGELGEVYVSEESAHVRESQWRGNNMIMLREYILNTLVELSDYGIVNGLRRVE